MQIITICTVNKCYLTCKPAGILVTQIVNPEKGRTLYDSWGTTRCSVQHWCNQLIVTIGFLRMLEAHCKKTYSKRIRHDILKKQVIVKREKREKKEYLLDQQHQTRSSVRNKTKVSHPFKRIKKRLVV